MTDTDGAGLSFQQAAEQAMADSALAGDEGETAISSAVDEAPVEGEQSAVEDNEEGLFAPLQSETIRDEQPDEDSFLVDVDGEQKTVSELRQGYMRQQDYTQKTQQLADMRREYEKAITLWQSLQDDPVGTAQTLYSNILQTDGQFPQTTIQQSPLPLGEQNVDVERLIEQKVEEKLKADPRLTEMEAERALERVNRTFSEIEKDYNVVLTDEDRRFVMQRAVDLGTADLKFVFAGLMHERERRLKDGENLQQVATSHGTRSDTMQSEPAAPRRFTSFREALDATIEDEPSLANAVSNL